MGSDILLFVAICGMFVSSNTFPISSSSESVMFLMKFGYLDDAVKSEKFSASTDISNETLSKVLLEFQRFNGLEQTGNLDGATIAMMNTPRCGVKDKLEHTGSHRKKRFALEGSKWQRSVLSYKISKYPSKLKDHRKINKEINKAFKVWSDVTSLNFVEQKEGKIDIDLSFEDRAHGDDSAFDGPGWVLAHAYFPRYGGDVHFDDDEKWTINKVTGINVLEVAAHEIGHSLGLLHSENPKALMAASYKRYEKFDGLHTDDVAAAQILYGSHSRQMASVPDLCQDASINTVTRTQDGSTFVFKGDYYWKISGRIANGFPRKISEDWGGLEGNLDASLTWSAGITFFFKDKRYWKFMNKKMEPGYPKFMSSGFPGMPESPDAACEFSGNNKTYFFKGDQFWRYDYDDKSPKGIYPQPISVWKGLPNYLDAAFQWENRLMYFFKGQEYYKFNHLRLEVESAETPPYPRLTSVWWYSCKNRVL